MAISASRINFLDKATNLPILDLAKLSDNAVYSLPGVNADLSLVTKDLANLAADASSSAAAALNLPVNKPLLNSLSGSIPASINKWTGGELPSFLPIISSSGKLLDTANIFSSELINTYGQINGIISGINNFNIPSLEANVLNTISKFDLGGYGNFLSGVMDVGGFLLCSLSGTSGRNGGGALDINIRNGLDRYFLFGLLNRFCNSHNSFSTPNRNINDRLAATESFVPSRGVELNPGNVFDIFNGYSNDSRAYNSTVVTTTALDTDAAFITRIVSGDIFGAVNNLRTSEISSAVKKSKLLAIDTALLSYQPNTLEYNNLCKAKGDIINTPMISPTRQDKETRYQGLNNKITSFGNNLINVKLPSPQFMGLGAIASGLYTKLNQYQTQVVNTDGANTTLPVFTAAEDTYVSSLGIITDSHRTGNLHPTTEVMLQGLQYA